ncbi:type I DNA topoisomerase [Patescibacteria group bacterium]|nr:MAG: type I DNA topoisomerase [Patescibacteria group bacterium]
MSKLVIVESPTKAKTISRFLGKDYKVESSYGHIRDLPKSKLSVDVEKDFEPTYVIPPKSKKRVSELKSLAKKADLVILATDEDREGEAIAWHLDFILDSKDKKVERITFHEITKSAIQEALKNPRGIDLNLVDSQQARRILDRLVGYELSPLLWKKIRYGLSAGRVQSVAVRLIVEREREIEKFKPEEYWDIIAELKKDGGEFGTKLLKKDDKSIGKMGIKSKDESDVIVKDLEGADYKVTSVTKKERKRNPAPSFTTSTLQQEAARKLGFSAKKTMMFAQQLYEGIELGKKGSIGLITYMRTDSVNLAKNALLEAKKAIEIKFGKEFALAKPRYYKGKKGAQEAHEAVRPTSFLRYPQDVKQHLDKNQFRLYELIWKRAIASQMQEAIFDATTVDIQAGNYLFRATGSIIKFKGFIAVYVEGKDAENGRTILNGKEVELPELKEGDELELIKLIPNQHFTEPPPRYTEASLVKTLEKEGIGRPSTYAPTMSTIIERGYVEKKEKKFYPTDTGIVVNDLLVEHFPEIVDLKFTAQMEEELDEIAEGKLQWRKVIGDFYKPFKKHLTKKEGQIDKKKVTEEKTKEKCDKCGKPMVIKLGRFGKFLSCSGYPECKNAKPLPEQQKEEEKLQKEYADEKCEKCGAPMVLKRGRFGRFLGCSKYPDCKGIKPISKKTGVKCPKCKKGELVEKTTKKGRTFYACDQYPKCDHAVWNKPVGICKKCEGVMVEKKEGPECVECGK